MKIVEWYRDDIPEDIDLTDEGQWMFDDHPTQFDLEVGDMIQLITDDSFGTRCFFVIDVWPYAADDPPCEVDGYTQRYMVRIEE